MALTLGSPRQQLQRVVAGRYAIEGEIGRGGMGVVLAARDLSLERQVALKLLPPLEALSPSSREAFLQEARTAAGLSHPNVVAIHAVEDHQDFIFIVMDLIRGESLLDRVQRLGPRPEDEVAALLRDLTWALEYAHTSGVVHRDVKPANILWDEVLGRAMLTDFGIALGPDGERFTRPDGWRGTLGYASPEHLRSGDVDGRSDLYSLGVTAFFALTGRLPFAAGEPNRSASLDSRKRPLSILEARPEIARSLGLAIDMCIQEDPKNRYQSAEALGHALEPALARRNSLSSELRSWLSQGRGFTIPLLLYTAFFLAVTARNLLVAPDRLFMPFLFVASPWLGLTVFRLGATRQLLGRGYQLSDVRSGLRAFSRERTRELELQRRGRARRGGRLICVGTGAMYATFVVGSALEWPPIVIGTAAQLMLVGVVIGWIWPRWVRPSTDLLLNLRRRFWSGWPGKTLWRICGIFRRKEGKPTWLAGQPTFSALGRQADDLFRELPPPMQSALKGLPEISERLRRRCSDLRLKVERVESLLSAVHLGPDGGESDSSRLQLVEELQAQREQFELSYSEGVRAIESLRLGLLRLSAAEEAVATGSDEVQQGRAMAELAEALAGARLTVERTLEGVEPAQARDA